MTDDRPVDVSNTPQRLRGLPSWLLAQADLRTRGNVARALAEEGLHRPHYAVLACLCDQEGQSQAQLCRRLYIDGSDMVALLADLERLELVERRRDPADARRKLVYRTAAGRDRQAHLDRVVWQGNDELLAPLDPAERGELIRLLTKVVTGSVGQAAGQAG